jgi:hypothetical protein
MSREATREEMDKAIMQAGEIFGMIVRLDAQALEQYLAMSTTGFRYKETCELLLEYRRKLLVEVKEKEGLSQ